jgi:hypothetical protein
LFFQQKSKAEKPEWSKKGEEKSGARRPSAASSSGGTAPSSKSKPEQSEQPPQEEEEDEDEGQSIGRREMRRINGETMGNAKKMPEKYGKLAGIYLRVFLLKLF